MPETGIDVRGPRFGAAITTAILFVALVQALAGSASGAVAALPLSQRAADPGFVAVAIAAALFLWGVLSPRTAPWGVMFRRVVAPRIGPVREREDPRPPRFAQGVGLAVTAVGLALHLAGVPWALPIAAGAALVAALLNAAFGVCLGCLMYLGLARLTQR
ncbi:DUF4395 domain-containing protein [Microbacterium karelineae]|uniref:DUF4395 domain-containing protein n=1 Tax=Microbacterium karelineae TaxID=2654283 RepID=UPI0012EAB9D7|nr:DUF4395 domain-containing protein [Microbacterium karelineae]